MNDDISIYTQSKSTSFRSIAPHLNEYIYVHLITRPLLYIYRYRGNEMWRRRETSNSYHYNIDYIKQTGDGYIAANLLLKTSTPA